MLQNADRVDKRLGINDVLDLVVGKHFVHANVSVEQNDANRDAQLGRRRSSGSRINGTVVVVTSNVVHIRDRSSVLRLHAETK